MTIQTDTLVAIRARNADQAYLTVLAIQRQLADAVAASEAADAAYAAVAVSP